ncbi:hypothetical protein HPP92_027854 [Vanilla planifolia]|uniref:Uncharacterized protein n=1 Tax=Vanilla planifolia TaxID=51239 RepID=A0A835PAA3_VANPL|nr:hypothetical protein HPP92_027854 [Vanilla planifolia]
MSIDEKTKDHPNDVNRKKKTHGIPFAEPHADTTSEKKKATVRGSLKSGREAQNGELYQLFSVKIGRRRRGGGEAYDYDDGG